VNSEGPNVIDTPPTCSVPATHDVVGTYAITCTAAVDNNYSFTYVDGTLTVSPWTLKGFYQPVDMPGAQGLIWNTVKNGSTVPFKFNVYSGTNELKDVAAVKGFTAQPVACPSTGITADPIEVLATGGTSLRYDTTAGQFVYNWQTPKKAGACYAITMTTLDGSTLKANFMLK
jgi:MBG domain (YGX type)